ncbi:MAG: diguanylate cyclase [Lachnospiraceae bacterium]|nr:diguanylate cyclase [Lachnospiraceae bacterium]
MKKILVVDDNSVSLSLAKSMLSDMYSVYAVLSGEQALRFLEKKECDLILLDLNMPDMSGYETLREIRDNDATKDIPIIFLTADSDPETEKKCFEMGAFDFIVKPFQKATLRSRVSRTLELLELQRNLEGQIIEKTKEIARISLKSMMMIANTVDRKDPLAAHHSTNVAWFAVEIAKRLGWSGDDIYNLQNLALIHDIGNIGVPDSIIRKKGPLTQSEYETLKHHTDYGKSILQDMTVIRKAAEVAQTHHERYDGKGYPNGLSGEDIPIEARIIAIADAFDSMTSDRSFRKKMDKETILSQFEEGRGTQFDPVMTDIAISLIKDDKLEHKELDLGNESDLAKESSKLLQKVLAEYSREIRTESAKDPLTGLWNRSYAVDFINDYFADKRHAGCLFMIDMDNFKRINDTYGHIVGDSVIVKLGETLKSVIREDDIICRIGGDEFVLFFKGSSSRAFAASKAEEIILNLDKNFSLEGEESTGSVSISIGISLAPIDGSDFNTLYNRADKALYYVKKNGKHNYHFYSDETETEAKKRSANIDIAYLRRFLQEQNMRPGVFQVEYDSFKKIYRFLLRTQKRTNQPVLILLITIYSNDGDTPDNEILERAFPRLKKAVSSTIRSNDIGTTYSSSQYIALLVDSTPANGYIIAERIRKTFEEGEPIDCRLEYDIDEISLDEYMISEENLQKVEEAGKNTSETSTTGTATTDTTTAETPKADGLKIDTEDN